MVSEIICLQIVRAMYGATTTMSQAFTALDGKTEAFRTASDTDNALSESDIVRPLLTDYSLTQIETALRWLSLGRYIGRVELTLRGPWIYQLTERGTDVAKGGGFSEEERKLFGPEAPYQVFLAHQFRSEDDELEAALRATLTNAGYTVVDGKVDGLEPFRHEILSKIRKSRFFVGLLTHRAQLASGGWASSVWLYQEIGAAVAAGKSPLLLVESGMHDHYAGELQKTYEYMPFDRATFSAILGLVANRLAIDLQAHAIPAAVGHSAR